MKSRLHAGNRQSWTKDAHSGGKSSRKIDRAKEAEEVLWLAAKKEAERLAQHGPVKVLWKDGKPVEPS